MQSNREILYNGLKHLLKNTEIQTMLENDDIVTCGFVGEQDVGKTCLIHRFFHANELSGYSPTIAVEISYACLQLSEGTSIRVKCWDTSGENKYKGMVCYHLKAADIVVIVFDLTNPTSFSKVNEWVDRLKKEQVHPKRLYLVGNKTDILQVDPSLRKVTRKQGQQKAKEINGDYVEISVKMDQDFQFLVEAFEDVVSSRAQKWIEIKSLKTNLDYVELSKEESTSQNHPCQCNIC